MGTKLLVKARFDDGKDYVLDAMEVDIEHLAQYYNEKKEPPPKIVEKRISQARAQWFSRMQFHLADLKSLYDRRLLLQRLHSEYENRHGKHSEADVCHFGAAYKMANDLPKHAGR